MTNLEYIDSYFKGALSTEEITRFDQQIINDPGFADEVFLYCSTLQLAKEELDNQRKERFRELYKQSKTGQSSTRPGLLRKWWPYAAAAAVIAGLIFGTLQYLKPASLQRKADHYIAQNLQVMSVEMSGTADSLQTAIGLYNENKLRESQQILERIAQNDNKSVEAKKKAGIVSLRLEEYDKAITYFSALEKVQLFSNPGKFYHAIALVKRNLPGDKEAAISLLRQVVNENLEGKEIAADWLTDL